jgi:hypothetical protein
VNGLAVLLALLLAQDAVTSGAQKNFGEMFELELHRGLEQARGEFEPDDSQSAPCQILVRSGPNNGERVDGTALIRPLRREAATPKTGGV